MASDDYWQERLAAEKQWISQNLKDDKAYATHLNGYYEKASKGITDVINDQYMKYAGREGMTMTDARKAVSQADMKAFAKEAKDVVAQAQAAFKRGEKPESELFNDIVNSHMKLYNASMRINRLEYLKARMGVEALRAGVSISADMTGHLADGYANELKRQAGFLGGYVPSAKMTDPSNIGKLILVNGNPDNFAERLWKNTDAFKAGLDQALTTALIQGLNPGTMASYLRPYVRDAVTNQRYVTERLARTEMARVQATAQTDCYKDLGVKEVQWIAEPSACELCKELETMHDGVYKLEDAPTIPAHPNCRCSLAPVADRNEMDRLVAEARSKGKSDAAGSVLTRKKAVNGIGEPAMPKSELKRALEAFKNAGGLVWTGPEAERNLQKLNASAAALNQGLIAVGPHPSRGDIYEELYHAKQYARGVLMSTGIGQATAEIETQHYLLSNAKGLKLSQIEIDNTQRNLKIWEAKLHEIQGR